PGGRLCGSAVMVRTAGVVPLSGVRDSQPAAVLQYCVESVYGVAGPLAAPDTSVTSSLTGWPDEAAPIRTTAGEKPGWPKAPRVKARQSKPARHCGTILTTRYVVD